MEKSAILVPLVTARELLHDIETGDDRQKEDHPHYAAALELGVEKDGRKQENTSMTGALTRMRAFSSTNTPGIVVPASSARSGTAQCSYRDR